MLANPRPEERRVSSLVQQRGFAFLLRLFILLVAQQSFPLLRGVGDSSAMLKASGLAGFLLAPQPALAQAAPPAATPELLSTGGNQKVTLSWRPVAANPAITKWQYQQKTGLAAYGSWTDIPKSAEGQRNSIRYVIEGLTSTTAYRFKVRAVNSAGNGAASNEVTTTPTGTKTITLSTNKTNNRITEGDAERKDIVVTATLSEDAPTGGLQVGITFSFGAITFVSNTDVSSTGCTNPSPATADACFPVGVGAITIAAGARTGTRTVGILPDTRDEPDEYFTMGVGAVGWSGDSILITIVDNDAAPVSGKPAAPTGLSATAGDGQVDLSWDDPSDSSITKYQVRQKKGDDPWGGWAGIDGSDAETTSHTVTGLENDVEYRFQVRARNGNGNGPVSGARRATPTGSSSSTPAPTTPLAAPVLTAAAGNKSVILSWEDIEGEEITGWWYQYKSAGAWGSNIAVAANVRKVVVRGLDNDTAYTFRIFAVAGARQSVWSNQATGTPSAGAAGNVIISTPSLTVTEGSGGTYRTGSYTVALSTPPSSATTVTPSIGTNPANAMIEVSGALTFNSSNYNTPQTVTVTPVKDTDTTGTTSPITVSHTVSPSYGGNDDLSVSVTVIDRTPSLQLSTDPEDVTEGGAIRLEVRASRAFSGSLPVRLSLSARDSSGFDAADIPGGSGPREFTAEFGASGSRTGTVTIPTSRDGNTAEGDEAYEIRLEDATDNCCYAVGSDRTADGTLNDGPAPPSSGGGGGGSSSPSEEGQEEEQEPPAKPTGFTVTPGNGQVILSWSDPSDGTISKWQVQCKRADGSYGSWMDIPGASTTGYTISGLSNGVSYECRIRAVNGAGPGPASDVVVVTPVDPDAARAARAREGAGVGISRATLSGATDVIGGRQHSSSPSAHHGQ